ncbi:lipoyl synthase [bacterium]|nr:lipoyl synthase [bacterium]
MSAEFFPKWLPERKIITEKVHYIKDTLRELNIHTVCESARCPNIGECFSRPTVTFLILGNICSRKCAFCALEKGKPRKIDFEEPKRIAKAAQRLGLKHTVITSVTRDDLADGGSFHFANAIFEIKRLLPDSTIEVLAPDFNVNTKAIRMVLNYSPDIFNHNIDTVPRIFPKVRFKADYKKSLKVLKTAKRINPSTMTKSGLMVGLGETEDEVIDVMKDLRDVKCDILNIGQYIQPTRDNIPVETFVNPGTFIKYKTIGIQMGFRYVESAPFVRSTYNAGLFMTGQFKMEKDNRRKVKDGTFSTYKEAAPLRI